MISAASSGQGLFFFLLLSFPPSSLSHDESCGRRVREVARLSRLRFHYCTFSSFDKTPPVFALCAVPVFPFPSFVFLPLQSSSHIAASPKVSAKVKKDNMKYAAWATSQISRAYKVRDTVISPPPNPPSPPRLHLVGKLHPTSKTSSLFSHIARQTMKTTHYYLTTPVRFCGAFAHNIQNIKKSPDLHSVRANLAVQRS